MDAVLHALHEPRRREILRRTWTAEVSAGELHRGFSDVTFGAISQHLRVLADAGLVECRRDGRRRYYRAKRRELGPLRAWLEQMWSRSLSDLAALAEAEDAGEAGGAERTAAGDGSTGGRRTAVARMPAGRTGARHAGGAGGAR